MYECCNKVLEMATVPQLRTSTKMQKFKYKGQQRQIYIETLDDLIYYINLFKKNCHLCFQRLNSLDASASIQKDLLHEVCEVSASPKGLSLTPV